MRTKTFAATAVALVVVGFAAGYTLGPLRYHSELERARTAEEQAHQRLWGDRRAKAEHSFQLVRYLDEGAPEKTRDWLNLMVDSWISETAAHSRPVPWIRPDMQPCSDTAFLARVARHREQHPVTYDDPEYAEWMSNILSTAVHVEEKGDGNTEPEN